MAAGDAQLHDVGFEREAPSWRRQAPQRPTARQVGDAPASQKVGPNLTRICRDSRNVVGAEAELDANRRDADAAAEAGQPIGASTRRSVRRSVPAS